jgi:hypothetical protein
MSTSAMSRQDDRTHRNETTDKRHSRAPKADWLGVCLCSDFERRVQPDADRARRLLCLEPAGRAGAGTRCVGTCLATPGCAQR